MKYLILTVFLTVTQAASPIPRQAPNSFASTRDNVQNQTKKENKPTDPPSSPVNQNQPQTAAAPGNKQGNNNAEQPITVGKLPPVSITKDWTDRFYWLFSGLLVVIGGLQVWLLNRQLKTINRQADIAKNQETQMVQAGQQTERIIAQMKEAEVRDLRAYVGVSKTILRFKNPLQPTGMIEIQNFGKTPAYKVRHWVAITIGTYPLVGTLPNILNTPRPSVSDIFPGIKNVNYVSLKNPVPAGTKIGTPENTVFVFGKVVYEDAFKNEWYSNYRFIFGGPSGGVTYIEGNLIIGAMHPDSEGNDAS